MNTNLLSVLSDSEIQMVHETSLKVLAEVGVDVMDETIRSKLLAAGARPGAASQRVIFTEKMVMEAVQKCERNIVLNSVRGESYRLEPGSRFYSSCCVDPFIIDNQEDKRPPRLEDCRKNSLLIDALDLISMPYKMDLDYTDAVGKEALLKSNLLYMSNMSKHYICAPHNEADARIWMEMCEVMSGKSLRENRIVTAIVSPISPLTFDKDFLDLLKILVPYGIMLIILPCPMTGASSPFSLAGTVVTYNAENLAAIVIIQHLQSGTPVCYHQVGQGFNMQHGNSSLGGPEKTLLALAAAEMGRFYGLPCGAAATATDSVAYDFQNGAESMSQLLMTSSGKANLLTGIGSIGNGMSTSPEQILFDCDLIELTGYLRNGIQVDRDRLGLDAIKRVGPGGSFLMDDLTIQLLHSREHFHTGHFERSGSAEKSMYATLHERAVELVRRHKPDIPEAKTEALKKYVYDSLKKTG